MSFWYDNTESLLRTAFRTSGTVVPRILSKPEFWFLTVLHYCFVSLRHLGHAQETLQADFMMLPWSHLGITTALMTFFMVFYLNYCLSRYTLLYNASRDVLLIVYELIGDARLRLPKKKPHLGLACRHIVASATMFFFEVSAKVIGDHELNDIVVRHGLLTMKEAEIVRTFRGDKAILVQSWALETIKVSLGPKNERYLAQFTDKIGRLRTLMHLILDQCALQLPFQYWQMMNFMMVVNLCLWAYGMGVWPCHLASVIFTLAVVMFLGVRELASTLSDPYGEDVVDFPTHLWAYELIQHSQELVQCDWEMTIAHSLHQADESNELRAMDIEEMGEIHIPLPATRQAVARNYGQGSVDGDVNKGTGL